MHIATLRDLLSPGDTVTVRATSGATHTGTVDAEPTGTPGGFDVRTGQYAPDVGGVLNVDGVVIATEHIESVAINSHARHQG